MTIRVILADDHAVVRKGIRDFLEEDGDIQVVAEASDGARVKDLLAHVPADVAVLDVRMPHATGIEVTRWIREHKLAVRVLILTAYDDDPFVVAAIQAGANGYVMKNAEADAITAAVRTIHAGHSAFAPDLTQKVLNHLVLGQDSTASDEPLTEREHDILQWAARGLTNKGIGAQLSISDRTVQGHLASIYAKLGVNSRTEAVTKALQLHIIQLEDNA